MAAIQAVNPFPLAANGERSPLVVGISSGSGGMADLETIAVATGAVAQKGGADCDADGTPDIPEGAPLVCEIAETGEGIGEAIVMLVDAAIEAVTPVAVCQDVDTTTDPGTCSAFASVDDGSFIPNGDAVTLEQIPPGPYFLGETIVTLGASSPTGVKDFCVATVTVTDDAPPVALCNAPASIVPPDAPVSFVASATDNCGTTAVEITEFDCFKITSRGHRVDKTDSCVVSFDGDTITILDSGGVGDHITWILQAEDPSGNTTEAECEVIVERPGN